MGTTSSVAADVLVLAVVVGLFGLAGVSAHVATALGTLLRVARPALPVAHSPAGGPGPRGARSTRCWLGRRLRRSADVPAGHPQCRRRTVEVAHAEHPRRIVGLLDEAEAS